MRFLRRRVWRAIPELDGLSDERARAFVRATKTVGTRRAARWALMALAVIFTPYVVVVVYLVAADALGWWPARFALAVDESAVLLWTLIAAGLLIWVSTAWVLYRWLVLRGVRMTLFGRAQCVRCGVSLVGLRLDEECAVRCPGCGTSVCAEEGLGEIGESAGFAPRCDVRPSRLSLAWYRRRWGRNTAALIGVVACAAAPIARFEWLLRRDERLAQADRTGIEPLNELSRSAQPAASSPSDGNAWMKFEAARIRIEKANKDLWDNELGEKNANGLTRKPDFGAVGERYAGQSGYADERDYRGAVELAERMLEPYRHAGVFSELHEMRSQTRRDLQLIVNPEAAAMTVFVVQLNQARDMARVNKARMAVALRKGDPDEFEDALCTTLALGGMCAEYPSLLGMLSSNACDALAFGQARAALVLHPTADWLDRIESALRQDRARPPRSYAFRGERAAALDTLAVAFADRSLIRGKVFETRFGDYKGVRQRVGGYTENRRVLEDAFAVLIADADKARLQRSAGPVIPEDLYYAGLLLSMLDVAMRSFDQLDTEREGLRTMIALERYRLIHGGYPGGLAELVPSTLIAEPIDPWTGKAVVYKRMTADERSVDPQHRGYLLWSVGRDGIDNGGRATERPADRYGPFGSAKFAGFDFILNDTDR